MIKHLQRAEERQEIKYMILQCEDLARCTPDGIAEIKYQSLMKDYAHMYHRIVGDWFRR